MSKEEPRNREEAFAWQFEDDVRCLHVAALMSKCEFDKALERLQAHIHTYNKLSIIKTRKTK